MMQNKASLLVFIALCALSTTTAFFSPRFPQMSSTFLLATPGSSVPSGVKVDHSNKLVAFPKKL